MNDEILEAEVIEEDAPGHSPPATGLQLAPRERRSEVLKPLDVDQLVASMEQYQRMLPRLLHESDYQAAGEGKRFVKKSGWRKIATAFDLDVTLIRSYVERDEMGQPVRAEVWARAISPSGRMIDGDGYCSLDESRFSGPRGNTSKLENDLRATATTRAMNRAISGLVGMGEVSAEEVDSGPAAAVPADAEQIDRVRLPIGWVIGQLPADHATVEAVLTAIREDNGGEIPLTTIRALAHLANARKRHQHALAEQKAAA